MARQVKEDGQVLTRKRAKLREPGMWKVLLHNDDYTTQEFVVFLLKSVFRKPEPEATSATSPTCSATSCWPGGWCGRSGPP